MRTFSCVYIFLCVTFLKMCVPLPVCPESLGVVLVAAAAVKKGGGGMWWWWHVVVHGGMPAMLTKQPT